MNETLYEFTGVVYAYKSDGSSKGKNDFRVVAATRDEADDKVRAAMGAKEYSRHEGYGRGETKFWSHQTGITAVREIDQPAEPEPPALWTHPRGGVRGSRWVRS